jgi:transposase InsO family protein
MEFGQGDRSAGRCDGDEGCARTPSLRQRAGVRSLGPAQIARGTGAKTAYIEPGSPWENGYCESFNSKLRDELLNGEIFYSIQEIKVLAQSWRVHYNTIRPHSSLGYRPPAPQPWLIY